MKANELMVGDWIYRPCCSDQVKEIRRNGIIGLDSARGLVLFSELEPIPITPEILEKNGFSEDYRYEDLSYAQSCGDVIGIHICGEKGLMDEMYFKYVHQLQHALRLCEIEKEIIL